MLLWVTGGVGWFVVDFLRRKKENLHFQRSACANRPVSMALVALGLVAVLALVLFAGSVNGRIWAGSSTVTSTFTTTSSRTSSIRSEDAGTRRARGRPVRRAAARSSSAGNRSFRPSSPSSSRRGRRISSTPASGLLVSLGVVWGAAPGVGAFPGRRRRSRSSLLLLLPVATARGNTTSLLTGTALLLAAPYRLVDERAPRRSSPLRRAIPLGLVVAALVALKTTFLPVVVLFLAFDALLGFAVERDATRLV